MVLTIAFDVTLEVSSVNQRVYVVSSYRIKVYVETKNVWKLDNANQRVLLIAQSIVSAYC